MCEFFLVVGMTCAAKIFWNFRWFLIHIFLFHDVPFPFCKPGALEFFFVTCNMVQVCSAKLFGEIKEKGTLGGRSQLGSVVGFFSKKMASHEGHFGRHEPLRFIRPGMNLPRFFHPPKK